MHANSHTCLSCFLKDLQTWSILQRLSFIKIYIKKIVLSYFKNEEKMTTIVCYGIPPLNCQTTYSRHHINHCNAFKGSILQPIGSDTQLIFPMTQTVITQSRWRTEQPTGKKIIMQRSLTKSNWNTQFMGFFFCLLGTTTDSMLGGETNGFKYFTPVITDTGSAPQPKSYHQEN